MTELLEIEAENADSDDDGPSCNRRLLNHLGLHWCKYLIKPFPALFFEVLAGRKCIGETEHEGIVTKFFQFASA